MTTMELKSMAVTMPEVAGHPNRAEFRGVLTIVDVPSQRPPSGSKGRLVVLTRAAAEAALPSLLGMALDYAPSFDRHDVRRKVGVITRADIVGRELQLGGYLYARDFPEIVEEIGKSGRSKAGPLNSCMDRTARLATIHGAVQQAEARWTDASRLKASLSEAVERIRSLARIDRQASRERHPALGTIHSAVQAGTRVSGSTGLGMSYEVTQVELANPRAKIWTLTKVTFTGAAILRRDKAAYQDTWIELG